MGESAKKQLPAIAVLGRAMVVHTSCRLNLLELLNGREAFGDSFSFLDAILRGAVGPACTGELFQNILTDMAERYRDRTLKLPAVVMGLDRKWNNMAKR